MTTATPETPSRRFFPLDIERAAEILRIGGLVAFPTETVYGLGADATNARAVSRIFAVKGRPANHPLIVHLGSHAELDYWASDIPDAARRLAEQFWPGPLTLILKCRPPVSGIVTGGQDTVGLRMPAHPVALALLQAFGGGVAAPSANRFGRVSPTTAEHVRQEFGNTVDVIDGGPCAVGLESTILDLSGKQPQILRPGAITLAALAEVLGEMPAGTGEKTTTRAPGRLASHYAPKTPLRLLDSAEIEPVARTHLLSGLPVTVLAMQPPTVESIVCRWQIIPNDPDKYARMLYACLREADRAGCHCILLECPPATVEWEAVNDRLTRAATGSNQNK